VSKVRHLLGVLAGILAILCVLPSSASGGELLGELALQVDEDARVVSDARPRDGRFRLSVSRRTDGLTRQLLAAGHPLVHHWSIVPRTARTEWIELRLDESVRGVHLDRPAPGRLVLRFTDSPVAAAAMAARAAAREAEADLAVNARHDRSLRRILRKTLSPAPAVAHVGPFRFPVGTASPVRVPPAASVPPQPFGSVPPMIRGAWSGDERFAEAVRLADGGDVDGAVAALRAARVGDDPSRALLSLARGHAWSRPRADGEPTHPSWAAEAYLAAVGMYPDAEWAPWARGQAAYSLWRDLRFAEATVQVRLAAEAAPAHPDRPWWEVVAGHARIARGETDGGLDALATFGDGLPELDTSARFLARKAVATALWRDGDAVRSAAVVDLMIAEHPRLAAAADLDRDFVRIYLDAGRLDGARPRLERMRRGADEKVDRERARWWLHELALMEGDEEGARVVLNELLDRHPGSVLAPIARVRLAVLEAMARTNRYDDAGGTAGPPWPTLALDLRRIALQWPRTPVEQEALSIVAQIWLNHDLLTDGLELVEWLGNRSSRLGGATDAQGLVCEYAPRMVASLLARDEPVRGLGRFRRHLDDETYAACTSPELDDAIVDAAEDADLLDFAIERLTRSVTRGTSPRRRGELLVRVASLHRRAGRLETAARTLDFVRSRGLPVESADAEPGPGEEPLPDAAAVAQERIDALIAMTRDDERDDELRRLASEDDAFGHWARELTSAADFERSLDALVQAASNP